MINVTTRIAVKIKNLPPFEFDWNDTKPQKPRNSLTVDDILPSVADGDHLFKRAVQYVMYFLTLHFSSLKNLKVATGKPVTHSEKSIIVPMPLLNRDEKFTDESISILRDYMHECNFEGDFQVIF